MDKFLYKVLNIFFNNTVNGLIKRKKFSNLDSLFDFHFRNNFFHPCKETLFKALEICNNKPLRIIETGSSAWGSNSTVLFDSYVNSFGGFLDTVDIRFFPMLHLIFKCTSKTNFYCEDSVLFLKNIENKKKEQIYRTFVYLDSFDVDWDMPNPSMEHGLNEFLMLLNFLKTDDIILVDDTPKNLDILEKVQGKKIAEKFKSKKFIPGKGKLIKDFVIRNNLCEIIDHKYQLILKYK